MPPTTSKRIEVDLHLMANEDLRRLRDALSGFSRNLGAVGGADSVVIDPGSTREGNAARLQQMRQARGNVPGSSRPGSAGMFGPTSPDEVKGLGGFLGYNRSRTMFGNAQSMLSLNSPLGEMLAFGPSIMSTVGGLAGRAAGLATGGAFTQQGLQLGGSASGGIGGIFQQGSAFRMGLANTFLPFQQWLSNPFNQNLGDLRQMQAAMNSMGWQPGMASQFRRAGSSLANSAIPLDLRANLLDSTRFGTSNIGDIGSQFSQFATAARAATLSVEGFSQAAQQVADSLGQQFGTTAGAGIRAARGASLATGLRPDVALSGVNSRTMYMTLARNVASGQRNPYYNTFSGRGAGVGQAAVASYDLVVRASGLGANLNDARNFLRQNGRAATLNQLYRSYEFMREIWPTNMNPPQFLQIIQRGQSGVQAGFNLTNDVDKALSQHHVGGDLMHRIQTEGVAALGGGADARRAIQRAIASGGNSHDIARRIEQVVSKSSDKANAERSMGHVTITLAGAARDLFKLNVPNPDSSENNKISPLRGGTAVIASGAPRLIR